MRSVESVAGNQPSTNNDRRRRVLFDGVFQKAHADKAVAHRVSHDFRRIAVRNLERTGVPRSSAMKMVGHKTETIYRRYTIAEKKMLEEAAD